MSNSTGRKGRRSATLAAAVGVAVEALEGRTLFAAGVLDPTFGVGGEVVAPFPASDLQSLNAGPVAIDAGGKILAAGTSANNQFDYVSLARFNANGTLDTTFGAGGPEGNGIVLTPLSERINTEASTQAVAVLPSGKILVVANRVNPTGHGFDIELLRYNPDGALDVTFGPGGADGDGFVTSDLGESETASAVSVLPGGGFIVAGTRAPAAGGSSQLFLARYKADGSLDTTFAGGAGFATATGPGGFVSGDALAVLPGGKVVVGGTLAGPNDNDFFLARFNANGTPDNGFGDHGVASAGFTDDFGSPIFEQLRGLVVLGNGQVAAVGSGLEFGVFADNGAPVKVVQNDLGTINGVAGVTPIVNGHFYAAADELFEFGEEEAADEGVLVRFNADLTVDKSFGQTVTPPPDFHLAPGVVLAEGSGLAPYAGDKVVLVAGNTVSRFNPNGTPDATFSGDGFADVPQFPGPPIDMAAGADLSIAADGGIATLGYQTGILDDRSFVGRFDTNGDFDTAFGTGGRVFLGGGLPDALSFDQQVAAVAGGKTLILRQPNTSDGATGAREIIRLNANGTLDPTFGVGGSDGNGRLTILPVEGMVQSFTTQADGKILVAVRRATGGSKQNDFLVIRFNADGTRDTTFGPSLGRVITDFGNSDEQIMSVVPAPGGKVVAAGISNGRIAIARYNANGALDATFSPGGADGDGRLRTGIAGGSVLDVVVRPDGRIVVLASDPANDSFLYAFTAGGGTDTTFGGGTGRVNVDFFGQEVSATQLAIGPDGKLFVAGNTFLTADSGRDVVVARYTAGGAPDSAYGTGGRTVTDLSTNDTIVRQLAVDSSGRAVVLTDADGKLVLLRYQGDSPSPIVVNGTAGNDSIRVAQSGSSLTVTVNNRAPRVFTTAGAARLIVNGLDGDDTLFLDKSVTFPATLNGGLGGDRLHPGTGPADVIGGPGTDAADYTDNTAGVFVSTDDKADDGPGRNQNVHSDVEIVMGGSGNDTLFGANAFSNVLIGNGGDDVLHGLGDRDVLVGGAGKDKLFGEAGDDLLIGSRTTYDNSLPFLATLRFEWQNPANDYATRISRLRAGVLGVQITSGTVPNDSAVDTLTGDTERDWFVSHAGDILADKAGDETSTRF